MTTISTNNKRIAKNTLFLYFRMLFMMAISLYTSRVVLDKLGVTDFGIYNVVSGIVVMLGFLSGCMSNSVQRFLSFEMGRNNQERVNRVFNVSLMAHGGIALYLHGRMDQLQEAHPSLVQLQGDIGVHIGNDVAQVDFLHGD